MPAEIIRAEIAKNHVISFARFMELALYCPETGYYERNKDTVGRAGDFITSVSAGNLFGELLAFQFAEWLDEFPISNFQFQIIEAGAHDGTLAADILSWLKNHRPELFAQIEYLVLEPSAIRQLWQKKTLKNFAPRVHWFADFANLSRITHHASRAGIFFSNELLDAMPVHRFGWDAKKQKWFEWGVTVAGETFAWAEIPHPKSASPSSLFHLPSSFLEILPDGYKIETSPAAENWWREAANVLTRGKLLTIDYGHTADEMFSPARTNGTARAYFRHHVSDDLLANVGEQDLTAHVNFSAIQKAGEAAGLMTESFSTQPQFLTQIFANATKKNSFGEWNAKRTRQFQTLTHPEHLGRAFRVLVQSK